MANITELLNPFTPLAFLPPDLASQFEVSRYFIAATLGAYMWDIGLNLGNDYALLFKHRVGFPTIVYFLSKAFTLAFILTFFIFAVAPVENCNALVLGFTISAVLTQTSTAMLFFLRVTAVWHSNRIAYAVFSILWLAVLGAGIVDPVGIRGIHIASTKYCIDTVIPGSTEATVIMPLINDTAIFLAITYRVLAHTIAGDSLMARLRIFFGGHGLSALSRALLQSGQHFYLIAVATNIILLVVLKMPQLSPVYHAMLAFPGFAIVNAMACLVFRRIKFGVMSSDGISQLPTINLPSDFHVASNPRSLPLYFRRTDPTISDLERNTTSPLEVRVQKDIYGVEDANITELPNPLTPLVFLPPTLASQFEVSRYVLAATLGAFIWDVGLNLGNDYALLFKHRVGFPTIVYFISRAFTLAYIFASFTFAVAPVENCNALILGISFGVILSQTSTAMLFFLRVTAVWHSNRIAYAVFSILLIGVFAAGITDPVGIRGAHIGPTKQCIDMVVPAYTEVTGIMPLINDTAIFLAINYRILAHTIVADSAMARLRVFFGGTGLSTLSRALLESGQHFYLIAVATHVTLLVVLKLPQLTPVYHAMLSFPGFALINAMACLVFRRIKFGLISSDGVSKIPTIGLCSDFHATENPRALLPLHYRRTEPTATEFSSDTTSPLDIRVQIDRFEDGADTNQEISKPVTISA
ncbi:hypothetical protein MSAN_02314100 [Mycena sanguinolenta]|uniref:Uncharacterized protein n=1 Tax=Mycena sanguinolenta TaxID=230812 RepID=A0A8H6X8P0_9AGAR|nr:hypothetical protein MSAN_02314100 [Mycena sanguinolenta]